MCGPLRLAPGPKIQVQIDETAGGGAFVPWIRLYGRDGVLLRSAYGQLTTQISLAAPADGTYTVVVGDASSGYAGSGTYRLTATGIYSGLMLCTPSRLGRRLGIHRGRGESRRPLCRAHHHECYRHALDANPDQPIRGVRPIHFPQPSGRQPARTVFPPPNYPLILR